MQKLTLAALAAMAVALSLAVVPAITESALARKQEVCTLPSGNPCPTEAVDEHNKQAPDECRAGRDFHNTNANCPK